MAELKTKDGELTTAELTRFGILPSQPDEPRLVILRVCSGVISSNAS
jgi:hypothetical protein